MSKPTPADNAAFLKKVGMTAAQWHTKTAAAWGLKHPAKDLTIPETTLANYKLFHDYVVQPGQEQKDAHALANSLYATGVAGLPTDKSLIDTSAQHQQGITGFTQAYLDQLKGIQQTHAGVSDAGLAVLQQGQAADQAKADQNTIAAGGAAQAPSAAPAAAATLAAIGSLNNNQFGAEQAAAGSQGILFHRGESNALANLQTTRNAQVAQLAAKKGTDFLSALHDAKTTDNATIGNLLTTNLYGQKETDTVANNKAKINIAKQKFGLDQNKFANLQDYQTAMLDVRREANRLRGQGLSDSEVNARSAVYVKAITLGAGTGSAGEVKYQVPYTYNKPVTTYGAGGIAKTTDVLTTGKPMVVTKAQYDQYNASVAAGTPKISLLGLPQGSNITGSVTPVKGTSSGTAPISYDAQAKILLNSGYYTKADVLRLLGPKPAGGK